MLECKCGRPLKVYGIRNCNIYEVKGDKMMAICGGCNGETPFSMKNELDNKPPRPEIVTVKSVMKPLLDQLVKNKKKRAKLWAEYIKPTTTIKRKEAIIRANRKIGDGRSLTSDCVANR